MDEMKYFFIQEILSAGSVTIYSPSDQNLRLRDPYSLIILSRFFAKRNIDVELKPILAKQQGILFEDDILDALELKNSNEGSDHFEVISSPESLAEQIKLLFEMARSTAERKRREEAEKLRPRGPVIILGRLDLYPKHFIETIERELADIENANSIIGRFLLHPRPQPERRGVHRTIEDTYLGVKIPCIPIYQQDPQEGEPYEDFAVMRKVQGAYTHRCFIILHGSSSLGTLAACQAIIDREQNEHFIHLNLQEFYEKNGYVDLLIQVGSHLPLHTPWAEELPPGSIHVVGKTMAPVKREVASIVNRLKVSAPDRLVEDLYQRVYDPSLPDNCLCFQVIGKHPLSTDDQMNRSNRLWYMIGGQKIAGIMNRLQSLIRSGETRSILLHGPTGVGKELAMKVIYEETVLKRLQEASICFGIPPVVLGPRLQQINCAAVPETLAESLLFGICRHVATNVNPSPGAFLNAGEGVLFLDEFEAISENLQAKLLRAIQVPYAVSPIGYHKQPIPYHALIVVATNEDPDMLVKQRRLRSDLYARLHNYMINIPPLSQRPVDIPAIVAYFAEKPVRIHERVLTGLLISEHFYNVRDLQRIIAKAKARDGQNTDKPYLRIDLDDLEPDIQQNFNQIFGVVDKNQSQKSPEVEFEFRLDSHPAPYENIFESAALLLASVRGFRTGKIIFRRPAFIEELVVPKSSKRTAAQEQQKPNADEEFDQPEEEISDRFTKEWITLFRQVLATSASKTRLDALRLMGYILTTRFKPNELKLIRSQIVSFFPKNAKEMEIGYALGMEPNTFAVFRKKHPRKK